MAGFSRCCGYHRYFSAKISMHVRTRKSLKAMQSTYERIVSKPFFLVRRLFRIQRTLYAIRVIVHNKHIHEQSMYMYRSPLATMNKLFFYCDFARDAIRELSVTIHTCARRK